MYTCICFPRVLAGLGSLGRRRQRVKKRTALVARRFAETTNPRENYAEQYRVPGWCNFLV